MIMIIIIQYHNSIKIIRIILIVIIAITILILSQCRN